MIVSTTCVISQKGVEEMERGKRVKGWAKQGSRDHRSSLSKASTLIVSTPCVISQKGVEELVRGKRVKGAGEEREEGMRNPLLVVAKLANTK